MKHTVCVIEGNVKVRSIINSVLARLGVAITNIESAQESFDAVLRVKPSLVICVHEPANTLAFTLSSRLKITPELSNTKFLLTASKQHVTALQSKAKGNGVDEILAKPFKSEDLQAVVDRLLSQASIDPQQSAQVPILIQEPVLQHLFERVVQKRNAAPRICETPTDVITFAKNNSCNSTFVDVRLTPTLEWYDPKRMGTLVLITAPDSQKLPKGAEQEGVQVLTRPLSIAKIDEVLDQLLPKPVSTSGFESAQLEPREQALFAARISAAIYEALLNQPALKIGDWQDAADLARAEVLNVCRTLEKLITAG